MSLLKMIPVDPVTVLHLADEQVFEQKMKMKEEKLDEWPYIDQTEYLKQLESIAQQYKIEVNTKGVGNKVDYRLVNSFVASFPNAFLEYKKKSNVT